MSPRSYLSVLKEMNYPGLEIFDRQHWYGLCHIEYKNHLPDWVMDHPDKLLDEGQIIVDYKNHRNRLAEVVWPSSQPSQGKKQTSVVLKAFGARNLADRVRISTREARSIRHLRNARLLREKGIRTPEPVFLALPKMSGSETRQHRHYLAVEPIRSYRLRDLLDDLQKGQASVRVGSREITGEQLIAACGRFIREVHDQGVVHRDMSGGNILIPEDWDGNMNDLKSTFFLIDINRLRSVGADMSIHLRIQDLEKLNFPAHYLRAYYDAYAGDSGDIQQEWPRFMKYRTAYRRMRETKSRTWRNILMVSTYWTRSG